MMFEVRTTPVEYGTQPYKWDIKSQYECTWYSYYRALEVGMSAPCWWDRATQTGSYTDAKDWLENFREPWEVKDTNYTPVAGDIVVWDGEYGHVQFMETDSMYSEYRSGNPDSFSNGKLSQYKGVLLGYLHYPYESINPVERNENVPQIKATDEQLRIRTQPNLDGEIVGHTKLGFYNVLSETEARTEDKVKVDGLEKWYEISKGRYCANITTEYFMPSGDGFIKEFERYIVGLKTTITKVKDENADLKADMMKIEEVAEKWNL